MLEIEGLYASYLVNEYIAHKKSDASREDILRYISLLKKGPTKELLKHKKIKELFEKSSENYRRTGFIELYVLNDVNLKFEGGILGVVGESGAGKSTLALLMLGLKPENLVVKEGKVIFDGVNMLENPEKARELRATHIGYIGQGTYTYLNPLMENAYQILESAEVASNNAGEALDLFIKAIQSLELDKRMIFTYPKMLSGGEIRKIAIAMALAKKLKLLVGDEPFRNIDVYHAMRLATTIREIVEKTNAGAIIMTHNISLLAQIADEIAVMYNGVIIERGPTEKIFENPIHPYTKGLIGALPDIRKPKKKLIYVPGEPIPKFIKPNFCPFFNRCPYASEECLESIPKPKIVNGTIVRCVKAEELASIPPEEFWGRYIE